VAAGLEHYGAGVMTAASAAEALNLLQTQRVTVVRQLGHAEHEYEVEKEFERRDLVLGVWLSIWGRTVSRDVHGIRSARAMFSCSLESEHDPARATRVGCSSTDVPATSVLGALRVAWSAEMLKAICQFSSLRAFVRDLGEQE
jgi:hypothetical protein